MNNLKNLASAIKQEVEKKLPGIEAHKSMLPEGRTIPNNYLDQINNYKQSAVFALLFQENETIHLLLTQRHQYEGKHSGQISFPGGKKEEQDENLLITAYRETQEEVGIHEKSIELISSLSPLYITVSNFFVQPYLGYISNLPELVINAREVKSIVKFPILDLNNPSLLKIKKIEASSGLFLKVPAFELGEHVIWGATAMMLREIGEIIKPIVTK
jgi:8-oxo-dGTP pyrophosphatase MutT (NUDIX family)